MGLLTSEKRPHPLRLAAYLKFGVRKGCMGLLTPGRRTSNTPIKGEHTTLFLRGLDFGLEVGVRKKTTSFCQGHMGLLTRGRRGPRIWGKENGVFLPRSYWALNK